MAGNEHAAAPLTGAGDDDWRRQRYVQLRRVTLIGAVLDVALAAVKVMGGIAANSQGLVADGVHSLSDFVTDILVLVAAKHAHADADEDHPYGHGRYETVATVLLGVVLIGVGVGIVLDSVSRVTSPESLAPPAAWAMIIAAVSVVTKEGMYHYTMRYARRLRSSLLHANAWHTRSDAISSVVVIMGVGGALVGLPYLDAAAAVIVAWMVGRIGFDLARDGTRELVDTGLDPEQVEELRQTMLTVDGVQDLHMLRTRQLGGRAFVDVHIILDNPLLSVSEGHQIGERVRYALARGRAEVDDVTVHIDPEDDEKSRPSDHLAPRDELERRLEQAWRDIPEAAERRRLNLHYLDGQIVVEVELPFARAGTEEEAAALAGRLREALDGDPDVAEVRVLFSVG